MFFKINIISLSNKTLKCPLNKMIDLNLLSSYKWTTTSGPLTDETFLRVEVKKNNKKIKNLFILCEFYI